MSEFEEEFKKRLKTVSFELNDIEKLLKDNGINIPNDNIKLYDSEKIWIPKKYIRTVEYYFDEYKLDLFFKDSTLAKNIAYALQTSDLFNYFLNRFDIGLSVGKIFFKHAIINHLSIIEAFIYGIAKKYHVSCTFENKVCVYNKECPYYFKKEKKYSFKKLVEKFLNLNLLDFKKDSIKKLIKIKGLRDSIHIWDSDSRDYFNEEYGLKNYNFLITFLKSIKNQLSESLETFESEKNKCKMIQQKNR